MWPRGDCNNFIYKIYGPCATLKYSVFRLLLDFLFTFFTFIYYLCILYLFIVSELLKEHQKKKKRIKDKGKELERSSMENDEVDAYKYSRICPYIH